VYAFCWVVGFVESGDAWIREVDRIAIACARWFGKVPPTPDELAAPEVMVTTHWEGNGLDGPMINIAQTLPPRTRTRLTCRRASE
jgi:hypothetical protein